MKRQVSDGIVIARQDQGPLPEVTSKYLDEHGVKWQP
jgi:hypothetical protein